MIIHILWLIWWIFSNSRHFLIKQEYFVQFEACDNSSFFLISIHHRSITVLLYHIFENGSFANVLWYLSKNKCIYIFKWNFNWFVLLFSENKKNCMIVQRTSKWRKGLFKCFVNLVFSINMHYKQYPFFLETKNYIFNVIVQHYIVCLAYRILSI